MQKIRKYHFLITVILLLAIAGCNDVEFPTILIVDKAGISASDTLFIYHSVSMLHESSESYFAVSKDACSILDDSTSMIASTRSYARIDSVKTDTVFVSSYYAISNINSSGKIILYRSEIGIDQTHKRNLIQYLVNSKDCRK